MLLKGQQQPGHHARGAGGGGGHDETHGGVDLQHRHGVGDGLLKHGAADVLFLGRVGGQVFGLSPDQPAHGADGALQRDGGR